MVALRIACRTPAPSATIITALVTDFALLRVLLGIGESVTYPCNAERRHNSLQRSEEFANRLLICRAEIFKAFCHVTGFAAVTQNSIAKCQRGAVVHQHWLEAYSP